MRVNRLINEIAIDANEGAQLFIQQAAKLIQKLDEQNLKILQQQAQSFVETRKKSRVGQFIDLRVYSPEDQLLIRIADDKHEAIDKFNNILDTHKHKVTNTSTINTEIVKIDNSPYLIVTFPLFNQLPEPIGYVDALFKPASTLIAAINERVMRTATSVIILVIATALLLYPIVRSLIKRILILSRALLDANLEKIAVLGSAIAKRDSYTDLHNFRVTIYAVKTAEKMGIDVKNIQSLIKGAFLHDIGKIGIRDKILLKPGKLDDAEFAIMKSHVNHGIEIVNRAEWLQDAMDVIHNHHEKFDGSGYPRGVNQDNIPINARIFTVVDVFDALTSQRPYKAAFTLTESLQILERGRNTHFDPIVLDHFAPIAESLHRQFSNAEDSNLRDILKQITDRYFIYGEAERLKV